MYYKDTCAIAQSGREGSRPFLSTEILLISTVTFAYLVAVAVLVCFVFSCQLQLSKDARMERMIDWLVNASVVSLTSRL